MNITVDISIGELLDKLTILELKKEIIKDENKLLEITKELEVLMVFKNIKLENIFYYNILKWVNHQIWIFTDIIKDSKDLNCEFAQLSKKIFDYNQYRFRVKNMLNSKSAIREQKSYKNDSINIKVNFKSFYASLTKINKLKGELKKENNWQSGFGGVFDKIIALGGETQSEKRSRTISAILSGTGNAPDKIDTRLKT